MENNEQSESLKNHQVSTELFREKIRNYSRQQRDKKRATDLDALRFGLGEIQAKIEHLHNLTEKDVGGLASRIKRRKHATVEDMYRLCHAFLQSNENIRAFAKIPGAIQVLVKELTSSDSERQVAASECLCNLSLGEPPVCEKIASMAGSYFVTYLDCNEERLKRTSLWTLANILATGGKPAQTLMHMELVPKLWTLYIAVDLGADAETSDDYRIDAAICLQIISTQAKHLMRDQDLVYILEKINTKNPTCAGGEYHLQIIFNLDLVSSNCLLSEQQLVYLINYCLNNLAQCTTKHLQNAAAWRLRTIYAVRVLSNVNATQPMAFSLLLTQLSTVWQTNLVQVLNKLFAIPSEVLTKETLWLLKTILAQDSSAAFLPHDSLINNLRIPQANALVA